MCDENYYKNEIIKMVQKINRVDILNYIYIVVSDIIKERTEKENEYSKN